MRRPSKAKVREAVSAYFSKQIDYAEFLKKVGPLVPQDPLEKAVFEASFLHAFSPSEAADRLWRTREQALRDGRKKIAERCLFELQLLASRQGDHETAVRICRQLAREHPGTSAFLFLAREEEAVGNWAAAIVAYRRLLRRKGMKSVASREIKRLARFESGNAS